MVRGGGKRDRTADLLHAMQALSQLSYTPTANRKLYRSAAAWQTAAHAARRHPRYVSAIIAPPARAGDRRRRSPSHSCRFPTPLPSRASTFRGRVDPHHRRHRRPRPSAGARVRSARRDRGAAWPCRAQARSALRRDRRRRASAADDPATRSRQGRRAPISTMSPVPCAASSDGSMALVHTAAFLGSLGPDRASGSRRVANRVRAST